MTRAYSAWENFCVEGSYRCFEGLWVAVEIVAAEGEKIGCNLPKNGPLRMVGNALKEL